MITVFYKDIRNYFMTLTDSELGFRIHLNRLLLMKGDDKQEM
jgi:hypothetical protein